MYRSPIFLYIYIFGLYGINIHNMMDKSGLLLKKINLKYILEISFC